jgi:hypothetical protein
MVHTFFERRVERLREVLGRLTVALESAGILYEVVGGLAVYVHVERTTPLAGRLTRDIDVLIRRQDLAAIAHAAEPYGFRYLHTAGMDTLLDAAAPDATNAVHLLFTRERVRPEHVETTPDLAPERIDDAWIAPVAHLVRMKLTSYRFKDRAHLKDMEEAGLLTLDIDAGLPEELRRRLAEVRAGE